MAPTGIRRRGGHSAGGARDAAAYRRWIQAFAKVVLSAILALGAPPHVRVAAQGSAAADASNPLAGKRFYVDPNSDARRQAETWKKSRPADAELVAQIANQPVAKWWGGWVRDIGREVSQAAATITRAGATPVFVAYNIPHRDCGSYSAGGAGGAEGYRKWIGDFARGLAGRGAIVVLEPDALPQMDCLPPPGREERLMLIREAVEALKAQRAHVYIDAGNARWKSPEEMARLLQQAGIAVADGFALNVSNVQATELNVAYGEKLSALVGGKHFIIDTSRNGIPGTDPREWCNPRGRALGTRPTTDTGHPLIDAFLWVKPPGDSDGTCQGGPTAGSWWAEYALELSRLAATLSGVAR
ncbi:MAG TPA: glycoside hydrolase family 6 protein [Vicinamibacteria bacterium]|nr:glycoside hydrolase family 6 protein [Vicinamibacteria bacterium]